MIEKILSSISELEHRHPKSILALFAVFTLVISTGFGMIQTETGQEGMLPENEETILALNEIRDELGGAGQSVVLIFRIDFDDPQHVKDIRDVEVLETMESLRNQIESEDFVTGSRSASEFVDLKMNQAEINELLEENPSSKDFITKDKTAAILTFSLEPGIEEEDRSTLTGIIRNIVNYADKPPGVDIDFAGSAFLSEEIGRSLGGRTGYVTFIGFIFVFFILYAFFRKASFVLLAVLPIILSTVWTFGTLGFVGIPLSSMLTGVFSIIIGLGIDFAIHILHRFKEDRKRLSLSDAVTNSIVQVGKGLSLTTLTTITGFLALLSATLTFLQDFAIALSFGVFYSFLAAIFVVPSILVIIEKRIEENGKKEEIKPKDDLIERNIENLPLPRI